MMERDGGKCPVCGGVTKRTGDYEGHDTDETCLKGHYYESFSYGNSEVRVGDREWAWGHRDEPPWKEIHEEINRLKEKPKVNPQRQAFEQAIRNEPREAVHRYAFADWLDEHDCPEEADFYRSFSVEAYDEAEKWVRNFVSRINEYEAYAPYDDDQAWAESQSKESPFTYEEFLEKIREGGSIFTSFDTPDHCREDNRTLCNHLAVLLGRGDLAKDEARVSFRCAC